MILVLLYVIPFIATLQGKSKEELFNLGWYYYRRISSSPHVYLKFKAIHCHINCTVKCQTTSYKVNPIFEIWESIIDFWKHCKIPRKELLKPNQSPFFVYCILHICSAEFCFTNTIRLAYLIWSNRHTQTNKLYFTQQISPNQLSWFWHLNSLILFHLTQFIDCDNDPGHLVFQSYIQ